MQLPRTSHPPHPPPPVNRSHIWRAVSFCRGLTTATLYCMVLHPEAGAYSQHCRQDHATGAKDCISCTGYQQITYKLAMLTFKIHSTSILAYLSRHITARDCGRILHLSIVSLLSVPFHKTNFSRRAFRCTVPTTWNSLPCSVIAAKSLSTFKSRLKAHLFSQTFSSTCT